MVGKKARPVESGLSIAKTVTMKNPPDPVRLGSQPIHFIKGELNPEDGAYTPAIHGNGVSQSNSSPF